MPRILVAEDDLHMAALLSRTLEGEGYSVSHARDGLEALAAAQSEPFDAVLTDWFMPRLDGIELIRRVRAIPRPAPLIIFLTALDSAEGKARALDAGADEYLAKPYDARELVALLRDGLARRAQPKPGRSAAARPAPAAAPAVRPPFVAVLLAASTGGPRAVSEILRALPASSRAAFFVVLHGPAWMLETFAQRLRRETTMGVGIAAEGARARAGHVYVAPGDRHLLIEPGSLALRLSADPPENFVRPSADPLLRSAARAFGRYCVAVILTGMGRDGSVGAEQVASAGGVVLAQSPETSVARSMPQTVIEMGVAGKTVPLGGMAAALAQEVDALAAALEAR